MFTTNGSDSDGMEEESHLQQGGHNSNNLAAFQNIAYPNGVYFDCSQIESVYVQHMDLLVKIYTFLLKHRSLSIDIGPLMHYTIKVFDID